MGKVTGFMEIAGRAEAQLSPAQRLESWQEFHADEPEDVRRQQASRCMDCGVPFCQSGCTLGGKTSGCPLNNLIPEWNELIYQNHGKSGFNRLMSTNRFPEFTGRVCPALCQAACTCGEVTGQPVTIRANERWLSDRAWAEGWLKATPPPVRTGKKVAVVGSGPAGLAAADYLNKRGHRVTVYERQDRPGGLLMYGIPNMKLEKSVVLRRIELMREEGIRFCTEVDIGTDLSAQSLLQQHDAVVLACGAAQPRDLPLPGREAAGIHFAVEYLSGATKALLEGTDPATAPLTAAGKAVLVIGGGDTGNDCIATALRQHCKEVLALEMTPQPPAQRSAQNPWPECPTVCKTDYGQEEYRLRFGKDPRAWQTTVKEFLKDETGALKGAVIQPLKPQTDDDGRTRMVPEGEVYTVECQLALIAAGFIGCERTTARIFGADVNARGTLQTNGYATEVSKLFACGDMRRGSSLVVWALREGHECAAAVDEFLMGYTNL